MDYAISCFYRTHCFRILSPTEDPTRVFLNVTVKYEIEINLINHNSAGIRILPATPCY